MSILEKLEKLNEIEIEALLMLVKSVGAIAVDAKAVADSAKALNDNALVGAGTTANQTANFSTLFGVTSNPNVNGRSISFLFGSKSFLGYMNNATGQAYSDANVSNDPTGLAQYEVVNYRTMLDKIHEITQNLPNTFLSKTGDASTEGSTHTFSSVNFRGLGEKIYYRTREDLAQNNSQHEIINYDLLKKTDLVWHSEEIEFGYDVATHPNENHDHSPYNTHYVEQSNSSYQAFRTKLIGHSTPAHSGDGLFSAKFTDKLRFIPGYTNQTFLPTPIDYTLYLEIMIEDVYCDDYAPSGRRVRIPMNNSDSFNYMVFIDNDGDLAILMQSTGSVRLPWKITPQSIDALDTLDPVFYLVVRSWSYL